MAKILNLGKVVGTNGRDATINGKTAITLNGANGIGVTTDSAGGVTIDANAIKTDLTNHIADNNLHVTAAEKANWNNKVSCYVDENSETAIFN